MFNRGEIRGLENRERRDERVVKEKQNKSDSQRVIWGELYISSCETDSLR